MTLQIRGGDDPLAYLRRMDAVERAVSK